MKIRLYNILFIMVTEDKNSTIYKLAMLELTCYELFYTIGELYIITRNFNLLTLPPNSGGVKTNEG